MVTFFFLSGALFLLLFYFYYGKFLSRIFSLDDNRPTPAHSQCDGIDYVPTKRIVLLGHHFSSIAGAGPVIGPIIAGLAFGWLPVVFWILLGTVFIGGVHDFSTLVASLRHKASSIAQIAREYMSPAAQRLFLIFIWLALVYVVTVFLDLTAATFKSNGGVATSSLLFIPLALTLGIFLYRLKSPLLKATIIALGFLLFFIWIGEYFPVSVPPFLGDQKKSWSLLLIIYCFLASVLPVWILLQPRDYLSSYLLYASLGAAFLGILFGGFKLNYPAFISFSHPRLGELFPNLFILVACGACSGFHSIVSSGTTSKQLSKESDARIIGYGSMLLEGVVALISLITLVILPATSLSLKKSPLQIYGEGMGSFLSVLGFRKSFGLHFGLIALSTFLLTTLDTATRLGRYIFAEFFNLPANNKTRYLATLSTLILPSILVLITLKDSGGNPVPAWKVIWPVFGATNQLLAALALLVIIVWFKKEGKKSGFIILPLVFMMGITLWAIVLLIFQYRVSPIGLIAFILLILSLVLIREALRAIRP